jgi:RimJ/RimL family protein N-acetyltransferase
VTGPRALSFTFTDPIVTERLSLRLMAAGDLDDVLAYQGREDVCRYLLFGPRTRDEVARRIDANSAASRMTREHDYLQLAMQLDGHPDRRVIGDMYLTVASVDSGQGEIGWTLHPDFHGHGYATEAATAVLDLAFDTIGLHRVRAELDPRNEASIALCLRLGMRHEATFRQDLWFKGEWGDTGVYAILEEEWHARQRDDPDQR